MSDNHQSGYATSPVEAAKADEAETADHDASRIVSFNEARAVREQNSTLWTPREALVKALRDIDEGGRSPNVLFIALSESTGQGTEMLYHYAAGGTNYEYIGMLMCHVHDLSKDSE
jgi:hypothetical protein